MSNNQQINIIAQVSQDDPSKPAQYQQNNNNNNGIQEYDDDKKKKKKDHSLYELICKCLIFKGNNTEESDDETEYPPTETNKQYANSELSQNISCIQEQTEDCLGKKTLVLDLDETLVHSSFTPMKDHDYKLDITVQGTHFTVYVKKRAGCEEFLIEMAKYYEVFIYTASLSEYADPVIDLIDPTRTIAVRLYRQHCTLYNNIFVKDMTKLNRDIKDIIIIDNSEASFLFQPENAIHIKAFFEDMTDLELYRMMPFLQFQSINYDVRYVMRWLEIFEQAEDEVIYLDDEKNQQTYPKQAELDEFEELFPYKYAEAMAQQQQISYEEPLTNRRGSNEDEKNDEDELELEDNLDSHKGMLKNKIQYEDYQNGNYDRKSKDQNEQFAEETDKDINIKQDEDQDQEENDDDEEEEIKNYENYNQEDDSDLQESNEDKQNQQIIKQVTPNKRNEKRKKQLQQKTQQQQQQQSDSGKKQKQKKQFSKKPALEIEVEDEQENDDQNPGNSGQQENLQFYKDSTKNLLSQNKPQGFLTDRGPAKIPSIYEESTEQLNIYAKNRQKIKAKEYEDHNSYKNNSFNVKNNNNKILMTQPLEIIETQEDLEEAKKEFFKEIAETRLDPTNPNNFNSPVAKNTFINFLNKGQKPNQKKQSYRLQNQI